MCASLSNGHIGFCKCKPCSENEGPCTSPGDCLGDVRCGSNNCPTYLDFEQGLDCCYKSNIGDELFCNSEYACGQDEGDCDANNECKIGHFCGSNNCLASLGFGDEVDCCSSTELMSPNYPNPYPEDMYETWLITAPAGSSIHAVSFIRNIVKICLVLIFLFCTVVSYF